jgi:hypothetical protein
VLASLSDNNPADKEFTQSDFANWIIRVSKYMGGNIIDKSKVSMLDFCTATKQMDDYYKRELELSRQNKYRR